MACKILISSPFAMISSAPINKALVTFMFVVFQDSLGYLRLNSETVQYRNDFRPQEEEEESPTCEQATQNAAKWYAH